MRHYPQALEASKLELDTNSKTTKASRTELDTFFKALEAFNKELGSLNIPELVFVRTELVGSKYKS